MDFSRLAYYKEKEKKPEPETIKKDLVVYGGTPAGITAAVQASRMGLTTVIVEFSRHIGGMTASGLGATDLGAEDAVGGLSKEFYKEVAKHYGRDKQYTFEPHVAQSIFQKWLDTHNIPVYYEQHLSEVMKDGNTIVGIKMEDGTQYKGGMFMDCSYEGDLLARADVSYYVGRESNATYKEIYNGIHFGAPHHKFEKWIDPYVEVGNPESGLLKGVTEDDPSKLGYQGQGDHRIQAYNFRICLTKEADKRVPFPKPPHYEAKQYDLLLRYIQSGIWDVMNLHTTLPNGKTDLNNFGAFSTDYIGANYEWPEGSYSRREEIFQDHVNYNLGLLYFLANDSRVPERIREEVSQWGLAEDEFVDTGHFPHQLYIREGRRMISDYVMTDRNCLKQDTVEDPIGLASYQMDSHNCRRIVIDGRVVNEGDVQVAISPYEISYQSIRPRNSECNNLLVPVCLSSSHIAYGSIRMEPVFMILGQSAGVAAALAHQQEKDVQKIDYKDLKQALLKVGQVLQWTDDMKDDPEQRMKATFGKESI